MKGLHEEKEHLNLKRQEAANKVVSVAQELEVERQQNEVRANRNELDRLRKELKLKDQKNEKLRAAVDKFNERMTDYEVGKANVSED